MRDLRHVLSTTLEASVASFALILLCLASPRAQATNLEGIKLAQNTKTKDLSKEKGDLKVEEKTSTYRDWNTGMVRERIDLEANFSIDEIKAQINAKHPNLLKYPSISRAVALKKDDFLLILLKDSQGAPYPVVRVKTNTQKKITAELIEIPGVGASLNWFPPSRKAGWSRIVGAHDLQFMVQHDPFRVVEVGKGAILDIDGTTVYLADTVSKDNEITLTAVRAVDLNEGQEVGRIELDRDCFSLPTFNFDHASDGTDRSDSTQRGVKFKDGPAWLRQNFKITQTGKRIEFRLAPDHKLLPRRPRVFEVRDQLQTALNRIEADQSRCQKLNPVGVEAVRSEYPETVRISPQLECIGAIADLKKTSVKQHCLKSKRTRVIGDEKSRLEKIEFEYYSERAAKKSPEVAYELFLSNQSYFDLETQFGPQQIIHVLKFDSSRALLVTHASPGPFNVFHLEMKKGTQHQLQFVFSDAFLSDQNGLPLKHQCGTLLPDADLVHFEASGNFVRRDGSFFRLRSVLYIQGRRAVSVNSTQKDRISVALIDLTKSTENPYLASEVFIKEMDLSIDCIEQSRIPDGSGPLQIKTTWFKKYFELKGDEIRVKRAECLAKK